MFKKTLFLVLSLCLLTPVFCFASVKSAKTSIAPIRETGVVYYVTDGDTVKVKIGGKNFIVRLIGTDTPETKDPRKAVQCFGKEAASYTKKILLKQTVTLESDTVSGNKDKYGRLLRYVFLSDGANFNRQLIADGYAYEYTYKYEFYNYRDDFKQAQKDARENKLGLWADNACAGVATPISAPPAATPPAVGCVIKGNISSKEKIYHLPGCRSYKQTIIDEKTGEKWFCAEDDAVKAGFRKAKNC